MMYNKESPETIQSLFSSIAKQYDRTNAILSFSMHKRWNKALVRHTLSDANPKTLLDLCCGTGEIAYTYLKQAKTPCQATLLDFCAEMLECARQKAPKNHSLTFLQADAQEIPLPDESVECVTIAYGIRNVKDPAKCIKEVFRTLKPGGRFGILELTQPNNKIMRFGHKLYLHTVLPTIGKLIAKNEEAYRYLCQSIQSFVEPSVLEQILQESGFSKTKRIPLTGGTATILLATK